MIESPDDGCGKCLLGVRRLSRMKPATSSPERQREDILVAAEAMGGHIIGWADDWEVSGALVESITRGLVFATHLISRKAHDIRATNSGSAPFHWRENGRRLFVAGIFEPVDGQTPELWRGRRIRPCTR